MEEKKKRIHLLDEIRGFAIICMIVHHSFLDVGDVLGLNWGYRIFNALCLVQPVFWAAFIIISGVCTGLSRNAVKRGFLVLVCSGVITLVTALVMPMFGFIECEIYFGILHCLGFCMIAAGLAMPLIKELIIKPGQLCQQYCFCFSMASTAEVSASDLLICRHHLCRIICLHRLGFIMLIFTVQIIFR